MYGGLLLMKRRAIVFRIDVWSKWRLWNCEMTEVGSAEPAVAEPARPSWETLVAVAVAWGVCALGTPLAAPAAADPPTELLGAPAASSAAPCGWLEMEPPPLPTVPVPAPPPVWIKPS